MSPVPYRPSTTAEQPPVSYQCPRCSGTVSRRRLTLSCSSCQYVPNHSAD